MKRILAIRTSALGDVVLATPALRALAARFPGAELHLVTDGRVAPVVEGLPYLAAVWRWEANARHAGPGGVLRLASEVGAGGRFDLVVDLQNKARTRALAAILRPHRTIVLVKRPGLMGALRSVFGGGPVIDGPHASLLYQEPLVRELGVTADAGVPDVAIPEGARSAALRLISGAPEPLVAIAPGARWPVKRWPAERFAAVGDALAAAGARVLLAGGPADRHELEAVRARLSSPPIGDTMGLDAPGLAAALSRCDVLVTGDSAPSHLAQAVGTPVVVVFGPTSARRWGPIENQGAAVSLGISCSPCSNHGTRPCPLGHHDCLVKLSPDKVIEVALAALQAGRRAGGKAAASTRLRQLEGRG